MEAVGTGDAGVSSFITEIVGAGAVSAAINNESEGATAGARAVAALETLAGAVETGTGGSRHWVKPMAAPAINTLAGVRSRIPAALSFAKCGISMQGIPLGFRGT
jgi:hypothetical protein